MHNVFSVLSVLVKNGNDVFTRVSSLLSRRAFMVNSFVMGETEDPAVSRMTITFQGDNYLKDQIVKQLQKLHDVLKVEAMDAGDIIARELLLVKIGAKGAEQKRIMQTAASFKARLIEESQQSLTFELSEEGQKIEQFIDSLKPYGIAELCRTGTTALARGAEILK